MVFFKGGSSFVTSFAMNGNQSECPIVHLFSFLTAWNFLCQVFELNLKDPFSFSRSLTPAPLNPRRAFSGKRAAGWGLGGTRPTPLTQWPEPIKRGLEPHLSLPSHPSPCNSLRKGLGRVCLQFKSLAFCPLLFQIRRQELLWGAKRSSELKWE